MLGQRFGIFEVPLKEVPRPVRHPDYPNVWKIGNWTFDASDPEETNIQNIEDSICAWVGWLGVIQGGRHLGTEASG